MLARNFLFYVLGTKKYLTYGFANKNFLLVSSIGCLTLLSPVMLNCRGSAWYDGDVEGSDNGALGPRRISGVEGNWFLQGCSGLFASLKYLFF
jgi:hypothetical protein